MNKEIFDIPMRQTSSIEMCKEAQKIEGRIISSRTYDLSKLGLDVLDDALYFYESSSLSIRYALMEKYENDDSEFIRESKYLKDQKLSSELFLKNIPVNIEYTKGSILKINTPLTFRRGYEYKYSKENFTLCDYVHIKLGEWLENNDVNLRAELKPPFTIFVNRKATRLSRRICDPDNLENGRIINEIFTKRLFQSDNAANVRIISDFILVDSKEECGTEFIVVPSKFVTISIMSNNA